MDYEYKDQQFSVEIAEALIQKRYTSRASLTYVEKKVLTIHMERGGLEPPEEDDSGVIVKKALQNLSGFAKASEISPNVWRYVRSDQWIFGTGTHWIYLYYFPQEKHDAEENGRSVFPCKIGKANGLTHKGKIKYDAPEKRVESLTRGAREFPKIPLLFRTDTHTDLETAIHKYLKLQRKSIRNRPSKEWFFTNPRKVVEIVADINVALLYPAYNFSAILADME